MTPKIRLIPFLWMFVAVPVALPLLIVGGVGLVALRVAVLVLDPWPVGWGAKRCGGCGSWQGCECEKEGADGDV